MEAIIYKITSPSGKVYIGQTRNYVQRICMYRSMACKKQIKLYASLLKHGFNQHTCEIIHKEDQSISQDDLNRWEVYYWRMHIEQGFVMMNVRYPGNGKMSQEPRDKR